MTPRLAPPLLLLATLTLVACQAGRLAPVPPPVASSGRLKPVPSSHPIEELLNTPATALLRDLRSGASWFGPKIAAPPARAWILPKGQSVTLAVEAPDEGSLTVTLGQGSDVEVRVHGADWLAEHSAPPPSHVARVPRNETRRIPLPPPAGTLSLITLVPLQGTAHIEGVTLMADRKPPPIISAETRVQNVIIFVVDTLRADALTPYVPSSHVQTPHLTAWAKDALVFERAYAPVNWTKPSVTSLLTGTMPREHGVTTHTARLPETIPTAASWLKQHGFRTAAFSANGYISKDFGFDRGFDHFSAPGAHRASARTLVREAGEWLARQPEDQGFFLYLHTTDCHAPYRPSRDTADRYVPASERTERVDFHRSPRLLPDIRAGATHLDDRERAHLRALYEATITDNDVAFGELLYTLRAQGHLEDTAIVFIADHGEEFFEHGSVGHGPQLHAELTHIPLIIALPDEHLAARVTAPVGTSDVLPTLLHWLGVPAPSSVTGRDLLEAEPEALSFVRSEIRDQAALTTGRYRLIRRRDTGTLALFDHADDRLEQRDVASEYPTLTRLLARTLTISEATAAHIDTPSQRTDIDPAVEAQLRALGYVGTQRAD